MAFITINKANFEHNLGVLASKVGSIDKIMAVLKDNAYGHGLEIMAQLSREYGVKKVAVKNLFEADKIAHLFDEILVLVAHPPKEKINPHISIAVNSLESLDKILPRTSIHLNLDTGMHRNGFSKEELLCAFEKISQKNLTLKGIFTHYRSSDVIDSEFFWQVKNYKEIKNEAISLLKEFDFLDVAFHSYNSAAVLRNSEDFNDDYARCGISIYGYTDLPSFYEQFDLKPVMALWGEKISSRVLKKGQKIGYGGKYEALCDEVISTYDVGYGDGFFRFNGEGELYLNEENTLVGRVSMDSLFVKSKANEVCLFADATLLAKHFNTITYDVVTKLSNEIPRKII